MNIAITVPSLCIPHGGIRVIVEWANRLSVSHNVVLYCKRGDTLPSWIRLSTMVNLVDNLKHVRECDVLIISSPHDVDLFTRPYMPKKKFIFCQMLEHLFRQGDLQWLEKCNRWYGASVPGFFISQWNIEYVRKHFFYRVGDIHYIGNGVNFRDFPVDGECQKDGRTILVEGWECAKNHTKDIHAIGPQAARLLRMEGFKIVAYSQHALTRYQDVPHEYYLRPSLAQLNELYSRASVLIKASRFDARACAPMEAMTKGCVTVRAIQKGDDDLIHDENCVRIPYGDDDALAYEVRKLMNDSVRLSQLKQNCLNYVVDNSWDKWMPVIEEGLLRG